MYLFVSMYMYLDHFICHATWHCTWVPATQFFCIFMCILYLYFFSLFHSICIFCVYFYEKTALHQCLSKMEVKYIISQCDRWQCDSWGSLWLTGPLCPWTMVPMDGIAHVQALCSIHNLSTHGHTSPLCPWMVIQNCPLYTGLVLRANHSIDWPMMAHSIFLRLDPGHKVQLLQ